MKDISRNLTMLVDYYELTMGNGYFRKNMKDKIAYFDVFYRNNPDNGGYAIAAGLEQVIDYVNNLHFDKEDIDYLRQRGCFKEDFLEYLRGFHFTGDIWAVPEATPSVLANAVSSTPVMPQSTVTMRETPRAASERIGSFPRPYPSSMRRGM